MDPIDQSGTEETINGSENASSVKKLANCLSSKATESLYLNTKLADIYFIFKDDDRIPAHKLILSAVSPVFEAEFFGSMPEKDEVKISDKGIDADSFREFLQFFYLKEVELSMERIQNVMYLGKKYQIDECLEVCSTFLKENLTNNEMCLGFQLAIHYEQTELKEFCHSKISLNAEEVLKTDGFLDCDQNILMEIVKNDELVCREINLLEACITWACKRKNLDRNNRKKLRKQLKDVMYLIRYKQIERTEFTKFIKSTNLYKKGERKEISRLIKDNDFKSTKFNCSFRVASIPWEGSRKLMCPRLHVKDGVYDVSDIVTAIFSSNKSLIFGEFWINFKKFTEVEVSCDISIERVDYSTKVIDTFNKQIKWKEHIILPHPILIKENIKYKIQLKTPSNNVQLQSDLVLLKEPKLSNGTIISFHSESDASPDFNIVKNGVIPWLFFIELDL